MSGLHQVLPCFRKRLPLFRNRGHMRELPSAKLEIIGPSDVHQEIWGSRVKDEVNDELNLLATGVVWVFELTVSRFAYFGLTNRQRVAC
jgi:hypothetical protein